MFVSMFRDDEDCPWLKQQGSVINVELVFIFGFVFRRNRPLFRFFGSTNGSQVDRTVVATHQKLKIFKICIKHLHLKIICASYVFPISCLDFRLCASD